LNERANQIEKEFSKLKGMISELSISENIITEEKRFVEEIKKTVEQLQNDLE
jgi:archaellum component FlaC